MSSRNCKQDLPQEALANSPAGNEKEAFSNRRDQMLFERLEKKVEGGKLFLNQNLTRDNLCQLIGVDKNVIASLVSKFDGRNVPMYVNNKRLIYAAKLMQSQPNFSVRSIAEECGFKHLGTFYRLFRRKYGMTPADFERLVRKNSADDILDAQGDLKESFKNAIADNGKE